MSVPFELQRSHLLITFLTLQLNPGNDYEICVPCCQSIAFIDTRMIKSKPYTKIFELDQQPISVEYSDFTENILVSLISDDGHEGKAVVLALDSGVVEAQIPAAINNVRSAAVWHPGNCECFYDLDSRTAAKSQFFFGYFIQ